MARIGILTCSNRIQETNCASVVCLADMRKRRGLFERYSKDEPLDLVGIISCAGCPTLIAPEKILRRVRALAEFRLDALHFSGEFHFKVHHISSRPPMISGSSTCRAYTF
jgi:predicted metal-binding protein